MKDKIYSNFEEFEKQFEEDYEWYIDGGVEKREKDSYTQRKETWNARQPEINQLKKEIEKLKLTIEKLRRIP